MAKFATVLVLALVACAASALSVPSNSTGAQAIVTVCRNLDSNCKNNCTDYTVPADGSCWPLPGGSSLSMKFNCDTGVQCLNVTEYLLSPHCSGYKTSFNNVLGYLTPECSYWDLKNGTVTHGINCQNPNTFECDLKYCSTFYQSKLNTCSTQPMLGLNSSYYIGELTDCGFYPSNTITYWVSDKCKSEGGQTTEHQYVHKPQCADLLPYAKATFQYRCVKGDSKLPPAAPMEILSLLAKYHTHEAQKKH